MCRAVGGVRASSLFGDQQESHDPDLCPSCPSPPLTAGEGGSIYPAGWQLGGVIKAFSVFYLLHLSRLVSFCLQGGDLPGEAQLLTSKGVCVSSSGAQCWTAQSLK